MSVQRRGAAVKIAGLLHQRLRRRLVEVQALAQPSPGRAIALLGGDPPHIDLADRVRLQSHHGLRQAVQQGQAVGELVGRQRPQPSVGEPDRLVA